MPTYQYVKSDGTTGTTTDQTNAPGIDPHSGFQVINSSTLTPTANITPVIPDIPKTPDIQALPADAILQPTAQENQVSDLTKRVMAINDSLVGKDAYQAQQESAVGVDSITQAINDNNTAIKQLQNDTNVAKLKQEDRLAPMYAISGSQGAIDRNAAIKALTLSSISDVLQNNLVAAQHKADKAVAAQYGPLEAELKAKLANIQLIQNDPATTLADKNRATKQAYVLQQQATALADAKAMTQNIQKLAMEAGKNAKTFVATQQYPTLSTALSAIATAKTIEEAVAIQQSTGLGTPVKLDTSVVEVGGKKVLIDNQTGKTIKTLGSSGSGTGGTVYSQNLSATNQVSQELLSARGPDGYTDPNLYAKLRSTSGLSATEFDNKFGYLVNPLSVGRLGVGKTSTTLTSDQQSIVNDAKAAIDAVKQQYGDTLSARAAIIEQSKRDYGFDPSPYF